MNKLVLDEIEVGGCLVKYKFSYSGDISQYFTTNQMFVEYDCDVSNIPKSILSIPFVGSLIALTWLTDTAFYVTECDETFYNALKALKVAYQELYPQCKMKGRFISASIYENKLSSVKNRDLLLFSGGADAMTSYLRNIDRDLILCNIQGWIRGENSYNTVATKEFDLVTAFGIKHKRKISLIKSNFALLVDEYIFIKRIGKTVGDSWWHGFSHSMSFISISIPIAFINGCNNIIIASSFTIGDSRVCASYATTDIEFKFCSTGKTIHDGFDLSRQDKIKVLVDYQRKNKEPFPLKVCSFKEDNCNHCEKCFRTISGIIAEGGKPNNFGFTLPDNIKDYFVEYFDKNMHLFGVRNESISHWPYIKQRMKENMDSIIHKDFAEWFLTFDFENAKKVAVRQYYCKNFFSILKRKLHDKLCR